MQDAPLRRWLLSKDSRWQSLYRSQNTGNYDIIWKFFALLNVSIYDLWLDDTVQQSLYRQAIRLIDSLWQSLTHSVQSTVRLWRWKSYRQSRKSLRYLRSINLPKLPSLPIKDIPISLEFSSPQTLPKLPSPPKYLLPSRRGIAAVFAVIAVSSLTTGFYLYIVKDLPAPTDLINYQPAVSTKILSRNGTELFSIYEEENRSIVPLDDISPDLINATIALEDKNFYNHVGFDPIAIMRAVVANAQGKPMQGGSTITQQLVKNTLLTPEKTIRRKVRELIVAIAVDAHFTKQEILEMYFNQVSYGGATYGAQEAAERYFGTSASDISLAQASLLAGLPAAPSVYSPFGQYPQLAKDRQQQVLQRMVAEEFITQAEADAALSEDLAFRTDSIDIVAPHFVMYVRELLANQYGEDRVARGGLEVRTTIDLDIQAQASQAVREEVASLKNLNVTNGAALVTNPSTGEILAMVGSMDYFNFEKEGQVNATLRERQPGSSIKPVTYALAFENGFTPATTIEDAPVEYISPGSRPYRPRNYDGTFHGNVTPPHCPSKLLQHSRREALASSRSR